MDNYTKPATQYEIMRTIQYLLNRIGALEETILHSLNMTEDEKNSFRQQCAKHIKHMDELTLTDTHIKSLIDRSQNREHLSLSPDQGYTHK